jgi:hypothetical protein
MHSIYQYMNCKHKLLQHNTHKFQQNLFNKEINTKICTLNTKHKHSKKKEKKN